ncbi:MarR family winged helix-turn-helix transcriptional regulator [Bacillus sp. Marseille-P3661]|uniref:MarR family winged helix-turn-helix transcriptional regulator n=1 Tax=Bacillus sp. Marseille-P3661 TaxID=1936234 RepID=UPI000C8362DD|nr:MarR family transcriptional regulator [Bacillus sp. Marseille-P3661]
MNLSREKFAKSYAVYAFIRGLNIVIEQDIKKIIKNKELTFPGFKILWILYFDSNIRMTDLTFFAQTNISNVFRQLEKLNEDGLVVIKNGEDARSRELSLTEDGQKLVNDFLEENCNNSELQVVQLIEKIPNETISEFIEVARLLSNELIGKSFSDFIIKSSTEILNNSTCKP